MDDNEIVLMVAPRVCGALIDEPDLAVGRCPEVADLTITATAMARKSSYTCHGSKPHEMLTAVWIWPDANAGSVGSKGITMRRRGGKLHQNTYIPRRKQRLQTILRHGEKLILATTVQGYGGDFKPSNSCRGEQRDIFARGIIRSLFVGLPFLGILGPFIACGS